METETLQRLWYIAAILVSLTALISFFVNMLRLRKERLKSTRYPINDRIAFYRKRVNDQKLSPSQREYAQMRINDLKRK